jgi:hypothetical protein
MNKIGLTPTYFIVTILGYVLMTSVYAIFLCENLKKKDNNYLIIFGSALILYGYSLLTYEYSKEWKIAINEGYRRHIGYTHAKGGESTEEKQYNLFQSAELGLVAKHFFKGRAVLVIFFALSFMFPINEHLKMTDITALLGQFMVYTDTYLTFGYVLLLTYYLLYFIRNYKDANKYFVNKLQVLGSGMLIYHYIQDISYKLIK